MLTRTTPAPSAVFVDRRVQQSRRWTTARLGFASDPMLAAARIGLSIDLQDRFAVGLVFIAGDQTHRPASRATVEVPHETMDIPAGPLARHQGDNQLVLGIQGPMVPAPLIPTNLEDSAVITLTPPSQASNQAEKWLRDRLLQRTVNGLPD